MTDPSHPPSSPPSDFSTTDVAERPAASATRSATSPQEPARRGVPWSLAAVGLAVLGKGKSLLLLVKALPFGKVLITSLSMVTMLVVEATRYGFWYAAGFVALIFVHEMGHAVAIKRAGLQASFPVFIPFVGAFITLKGQPRSAREEADIALGGPIAGAAASAACALLHLLTGSRLLLALAHGGFFLNLFNMTPIPPLDGGRAAQVFSRSAWLVGLAVIVGLFLLTKTPQLLLIGGLAAMHGMSRRGAPALEAPPELRRTVAASFFGLCTFLALGVYLTARVLYD